MILRHVFHFQASAPKPDFSLGAIKFWAKLKLPVPACGWVCVCLSSQASLFIMREQISSPNWQSNPFPSQNTKMPKRICHRSARVSQMRRWHVEANYVLYRCWMFEEFNKKTQNRHKTPGDEHIKPVSLEAIHLLTLWAASLTTLTSTRWSCWWTRTNLWKTRF